MAWNDTWEKVFSTRPWGKYPPESLIRFVAKNFYSAPDRKKIKILEIGSGTGANLWYCAREGFSVFGVEGSKTAAQISRQRLDSECPGWSGDVVVGDIVKLAFANETFDAVIDVGALCCNSFEDTKRILSDAHRVLKQNGRIFSKTFATGTYGEKTGQNVGTNAWMPTVGPLSSIGLVRFTEFNDIKYLFGEFHLESIEQEERSMNNMANKIKDWVIEGVKL